MKIHALLFIVFIVLSSCTSREKHLFSPLPSSQTGIDFVNKLDETDEFNIIEYLYFNNGGGVAACDINNDGLTDLYFTSNQKSNRLYLNKGNLRFEDITEKAGVAGTGNWKTGVVMADVNCDGLNDIYVCEVGNYKNFSGRNQLFINNGDLTFTDKAHEYGLDFQGFSTQAAFFDYDSDGDLDMFLLNHSVHTSRSYGNVSLRLERDSAAGDRLFRNDLVNGKRTFHDVTDSAGIYSSQIGYGLGVSISDINNDRLPDIYVSNDFHENDYLYINNGNGSFTERHADFFAHTSRSSMGNDIADFNNDGLPDVVVLDMLPDDEKIRKQSGGEDDLELFELKKKLGYGNQFVRNVLQLNLGNGLFSEIGQLAGISSTDWSWAPLFFDADNDGWKDLFITSGIFRRANDLDYVRSLTGGNRYMRTPGTIDKTDSELYEMMPLQPDVNHIFRNNSDLTFSDASQEWGFVSPAFSSGAAYCDLDNDGDLDLVVNNINSTAGIFRNNSEKLTSNHFINVKLEGDSLNFNGTGAKVMLYTGGKIQMTEQFFARGFISASSDILHFGLGTDKGADSLLIMWPNGKNQLLRNLPADTMIIADINDAIKMTVPQEKTVIPEYFSPAEVKGLDFRHIEDDFTDLRREMLIPHSLSSEGPALAVADINNDGLDDFFSGGAKGQLASFFIQQKDGSFSQSTLPVSTEDNFTDDVDAAFFDADNDGDEDLYIVHGGNEYPIGNLLLSDALLVNDGKGNFSRGKLPFLSHNGSCVRPCDFDNDGDHDLFVGSESISGGYGLTPVSYLLQNDGRGCFTIMNDPEISGAGMITDAVWADIDGDKDPDLIISGEWMNITVFRNDKGRFTNATDIDSLQNTFGWWNCIHSADIDNDGDMDLIAGNLGLNTSLKASEKEPVEMFINDFDNNGIPDQVICSWQNGKCYPAASLDELESQIHGLETTFKKYSDFGGKTAEEVFGEDILAKSLIRKAVMFESCIFLNNGNGTFRKESLPVQAQFSPVRDIFITDLNGDDKQDLILTGNNYVVRPSYGSYDAGFGWCLLNGKDHEYHILMPGESGLVIKGDSRKIVPLKIKGEKYLVAGVNNGKLQIYKQLNKIVTTENGLKNPARITKQPQEN